MFRVLRKHLAIITCLILAFTMLVPDTAFAATKTPLRPVVTSCKANGNKVTIKWKKAKYAKSYRVYVQTGNSVWKYWKKVKKTSANKKKYSDATKYKLVVSGKKYKVYKQKNTYKVAKKKVTTRTYTYTGKYNTTYHFVVRAVNGKKLSKASKIKLVKTPADPNPPADPEDQTDPGDQPGPGDQEDPVPQTYTITYNLNGGTNNESNPSSYTTGDAFGLLDPVRDNYTFQGWFTDSGFTKQIRAVTADTNGNLTLYAKWHLESQNITLEGMDDMIWSWWYWPQVISSGDQTFWGFATKDGYCGIASYDDKTGVTKKTLLKKADTIDDHNGLALTLLKDQRILCSYAGGHNSDKEIHIRISDEPLDISSFGTDIVLESSGVTCYSQILESNGRYYLFYRVNNNSWAYRTSRDGLTWGDEIILIQASMQYYCKFTATTASDLVRILMYSNPTAAAPEIRMGFLNTRDNNVYGTDAQTLIGNQKLDYGAFSIIQDIPAGKTQRLFDAAVTAPDKPRFLFTTFTASKGKNDCVYYLYDSGSNYEICAGGSPIWDPKYQLGAAFIGNDSMAVIRNNNTIDYVEMYKFDGSSVSKTKDVTMQFVKDSSRLARPIVDINGKAFLWHMGYYDSNSYKNFDTSAVLYLIDQDKVVGGPEEVVDDTEYKITYELNGGTIDPDTNPSSYKLGDSFEFKAPAREGYDFKGWYTDKKFTTEITSVTPVTQGDLTLFAKWYKSDTTIENADLSDMIWSWWTYPLVVSKDDMIFWGFTTKEGYCGVGSYDDTNGSITKTYLKKAYGDSTADTNAPSVTLLDDGRVMCIYAGGPDAQKELHVRISDQPLDISSFTTDITLKPTSDTVTQFSQVVRSNGKYYLFYHVGNYGSWEYKYSADGTNWTDGGTLLRVAGDANIEKYYCRFMPTTDDSMIRILMCSNPGDPASTKPEYHPEVRMGFLNTSNNTVYDADASTVLGETKLAYSKFSVVQSPASGKTQRLLDVAVSAPSDPCYIFAEFTYEKAVNDSVYYLYDSGKVTKICDGGTNLLDPKYQLGAGFIGNSRIAVARNLADKDVLEVYSYNGSDITLQSTIKEETVSEGSRLARPVVDVNGKAILWHTGKYNSSTSYTTDGAIHIMY